MRETRQSRGDVHARIIAEIALICFESGCDRLKHHRGRGALGFLLRDTDRRQDDRREDDDDPDREHEFNDGEAASCRPGNRLWGVHWISGREALVELVILRSVDAILAGRDENECVLAARRTCDARITEVLIPPTGEVGSVWRGEWVRRGKMGVVILQGIIPRRHAVSADAGTEIEHGHLVGKLIHEFRNDRIGSARHPAGAGG